MPASARAHVVRETASSSRPYDRRSPTASPARLTNALVHAQSLPTASPVQDPAPDAERDPHAPRDHPDLPTYAEYKRIEAEYLHSLSPRKRDKALITQAMFDKIWDVLHQPEACTIDTPQFRFWVRKMFSLSRPVWVRVRGDGRWGEAGRVEADTGTGTDTGIADVDSDADVNLELERAMGIAAQVGADADASTDLFSAVVLHENRPVAIMEQLYELFCYCHVRARHGGRDKTCAVIRQHYSWVPKELTAQFVKACPTCALKRSGHGGVGAGVSVQGRAVGQRGGRCQVHEAPLGQIPVSVVPSSLGNVGWPTTGGPLDPANPEPCGVRQRAWLRSTHEDTGSVDPPGLPASSPARVGGQSAWREVAVGSCSSGGWNDVPEALTADTPPFRPFDMTNHSGFPRPFEEHENNKVRTCQEEKSNVTGAAGLLSALSNESLDGKVGLSEYGPPLAGECLSSVLGPIHLLGPISSETESVPIPPPAEYYPFQIDPMLLSFDYPGLGSSESGSASSGIGSAMSVPLAPASGHEGVVSVTGSCPLPSRAIVDSVDTERLENKECQKSAGVLEGPTGPGPVVRRPRRSTRRCGPRYGAGCRDRPLALVHSCSVDKAGEERDGAKLSTSMHKTGSS